MNKTTEQIIFDVAMNFYEICKMAEKQLIEEDMYEEGESGLDRTYLYIGNRRWKLSDIDIKSKDVCFDNPEILKGNIIDDMCFGECKPVALIESVAWAAIYNYDEYETGYIPIPGLREYVYSEELCDKMSMALGRILGKNGMYYDSCLGEEYMPLFVE